VDRDQQEIDRDLSQALQHLREAVVVPPPDPARDAALMAAFDTARATPASAGSNRHYWVMAALASAAAVLIAVGIDRSSTGRHAHPSSPPRDVQLESTGEFVIVPGAASLPQMESGTLVRMEVPVSMLPSFGVAPPTAGRATVVTADVVVAQDGLPRAVRLVN